MAPDSSAGQIKKAYYKLAMAHHPDKGGDTAEFQKIGDAYQARPRGWGVIGAQLLGGRWLSVVSGGAVGTVRLAETQVLSDASSRKKYDLEGRAGREKQMVDPGAV